jgi:hypothetical protein
VYDRDLDDSPDQTALKKLVKIINAVLKEREGGESVGPNASGEELFHTIA